MSKILVSTVTLMVSRDPMTTLPVIVPAHEQEVIEQVFGADNVQVQKEATDPVELDPATESERLLGKYGPDALEKTHGKNFAKGVAEACKGFEVKPAKTPKAPA